MSKKHSILFNALMLCIVVGGIIAQYFLLQSYDERALYSVFYFRYTLPMIMLGANLGIHFRKKNGVGEVQYGNKSAIGISVAILILFAVIFASNDS